MPILSGFLLVLFEMIVRFFLKFFDLRKAWILAVVTITFGLLAALYAAGTACIESCMPSGGLGAGAAASLGSYLALGWGLVWNGVTAVAFSCWVTVWLACTLYVWKKKMLDMLLHMA